MASVFSIMDMSRRGMGYQHIQFVQTPELKPEFANLCPHFPLPILVGIAVIPAGAGKAEKICPPVLHDSAGNVFTTENLLPMPYIVISQNIKKRDIMFCLEPGQVFEVERVGAADRPAQGRRQPPLTPRPSRSPVRGETDVWSHLSPLGVSGGRW